LSAEMTRSSQRNHVVNAMTGPSTTSTAHPWAIGRRLLRDTLEIAAWTAASRQRVPVAFHPVGFQNAARGADQQGLY
jgi:hypothetical protein